MSVPPIITKIFNVVDQLLTANVGYPHQQIGDVRGLISERRFKNALEVLRTLEDELTDTDAYKSLEQLLLRVVGVQEKVQEEKVQEEKVPETPVPTPMPTPMPTPTIIKEGTVYRVTLTNKNSIHRKQKKMRKTYKMLDGGPQTWSLLNIGIVYYTFDTKGSIDSDGSNVAIEDVELKQVVMDPVPEPQELLDGMLIQVKWKGYPLMTQVYRNVLYAESPVVFVTYPTKTPIVTTPFDPDADHWSFPKYLNLTSEARIEVLDCGQYMEETKPLIPDKGSRVNVCVAVLNSGETRVLLPDEFSNGEKFRLFDAVALEVEIRRTEYVECKVTKVGKTTCTLERYGEVPLGCILGVWRPVDKGDRYKEPDHTPHLWNCEWVKNKEKFVLDVYYTEIRLPSTGSDDAWVKDATEEEDDDALEQFEEYDYDGVTYICEGKATGEQKTEEIFYKLTNKKLEKTIYKTAQQIHDQVEAKFELFDARLKNYVLYDNRLWKIIEFNGSNRTYTLQREEETTITQEEDIAPEPILQYEIGQLVGYGYEFCTISDVELVYELTRLDQTQDPQSPEAILDETYENVTEVALDEWCMYKKKVVRLKLSDDGKPVREPKPNKKGVMISHVKIFDTAKAKRPKTVKESLVTFQADINTMFIHEKWNGEISENARVNVELKNGEMREGIVVGWRASKNGKLSYRIRFADGLEQWHQYQKIEVLSGEPDQVHSESEDNYSSPSSSESSSESESESDSDSVVDDEFDENFVWVQEPQPLGFAGEQVRYDDGFESDDEDTVNKVWSIVKDVSAEDLGQKKLDTEQLNMFVIGDGSGEKMVYLDDLTKVIAELEGVVLLDGEVFQANLLDSGQYKVSSCWRTFEVVVPSMCLTHYVPVPGVGAAVYLLEDATYKKRLVKSTQKGMYQLDTGENVNRTKIDPYVEPFKTGDTVHLKGWSDEIYKVTKTQGRKVDLESTWNSSKKFLGVDMSNVRRHSSDEYEKGDFVRVNSTGQVMKVTKSVNNRVSVDGINGQTFSPSELTPAADPSSQKSDMEDSSDDDN